MIDIVFDQVKIIFEYKLIIVDKNNKFLLFLESITDNSNKLEINSIKEGYLIFMEAFYPDDTPINYNSTKTSTIDRFNQMAADEASNLGNNSLHFLRSSHDGIKNRYSAEEDSELDNLPTSDFSSEIGVKHVPKAKDSEFGFSFDQI